MIITVYAKPKAKAEKIELIRDKEYKIEIAAPPIDNQANRSIISLLGDYFDVPKTNIRIVKGHASKVKIIDIQK